VALGDAGEHVLELLGRRVVGVVAEFLDAVGEAEVGDDRSDRLHVTVDAPGPDGGPHPLGRRRLDERLEALAMILVERFDRGGEFFVGGGLERAVQQSERLHPVLRLIHVARRYLRAQETT
jgi:hypothetical protein